MGKHHIETTQGRIKRYNQPLPLIDYLMPFVVTGSKEVIKIADIGSGYITTIGTYIPGQDSKFYHSDKQDFVEFFKLRNITPINSVEIQNMEHMTYEDNFFDIVHCLNALDHTKHAYKAVEEMIRICKPGGWIYIDCHLDQLDTGHLHYWNAKQDGTFTNGGETFDLKSFGFQIKFIDNGGETRYNQIIATLQK